MQAYLEKREGQKITELVEGIEDEKLMFEGVDLTAKDKRDFAGYDPPPCFLDTLPCFLVCVRHTHVLLRHTRALPRHTLLPRVCLERSCSRALNSPPRKSAILQVVAQSVLPRRTRSEDTTPCVKSLRSSYTGLYPK